MSNCRLFLVMLILNWSWIAFGSEQQCGKPVLVMDVDSVTVSSNDAQQHGFAFWTNELKKGPTSQKADSRVLHEEYPLGKPFGISEEAKDDRGHGNVAIAGRVETGKDDGSYKISFSQLGRPRAYEGKTSLTIRSRDRRGFVVPPVRLGGGGVFGTVVGFVFQGEGSVEGGRGRL